MKSGNRACGKRGGYGVRLLLKVERACETRDTTKLLINRINHPIPEMHELFAQSLFEIIFKDMPEVIPEIPSSMFNGI